MWRRVLAAPKEINRQTMREGEGDGGEGKCESDWFREHGLPRPNTCGGALQLAFFKERRAAQLAAELAVIGLTVRVRKRSPGPRRRISGNAMRCAVGIMACKV